MFQKSHLWRPNRPRNIGHPADPQTIELCHETPMYQQIRPLLENKMELFGIPNVYDSTERLERISAVKSCLDELNVEYSTLVRIGLHVCMSACSYVCIFGCVFNCSLKAQDMFVCLVNRGYVEFQCCDYRRPLIWELLPISMYLREVYYLLQHLKRS